ncbi:hypothetical protein TPHA_0G01980 [Tetrapisispora phaffii CBS 4417]|uniref:Nuclear rim protein 1 n=1 Tax=Tetrapisispora phaffii (strain ATCC 24235 / CBS 4417 / NBRC 1672 / NRRL Y-8282 / UCD 70-5) TaxID=1071381 RepID=G8BVV6_TETPH|nr:hypothetical protein TPHA_0G01980 [Tetrapisispora phaffii CBS 4417]CCE64034.1 hypothetical protein TPHA_0G01980 [Tetrapisispora phaffii CBS 4417]
MSKNGTKKLFSMRTLFEWQIYHRICDLHFSIMETINSIDWDKKCQTIAQPLGYSLTLMVFLLRLLQDNILKPNYINIYRSKDIFDLKKSYTFRKYPYLMTLIQDTQTELIKSNKWYNNILGYIDKLSTLLLILLLMLNAIITWLTLFRSNCSYQFYSTDITSKTDNIIIRPLTDLSDINYDPQTNISVFKLLRLYLLNLFKDIEDLPSTVTNSDNKFYYQLNKWKPSKFLLTLFCTFSPISTISFYFTEVTLVTLFPVLFQQIIINYVIFYRYETKLVNEKTIHQSMIQEMENKIIKPKMSKEVQDAKTDVRGNTKKCFAQFFPATTVVRNQIFTSHDIDGNISIQKFDEDTNSFKKINNNILSSRNIVIP